MLGKVASGQELHGFPPGYYVLTFSLFLWPFGALATQGGLARLNRFRSDPRLAFLLAWYLPYWIVCELLPTKLPHYMLPAYPALLLLIGWYLTEQATLGVVPRWQVWLAMPPVSASSSSPPGSPRWRSACRSISAISSSGQSLARSRSSLPAGWAPVSAQRFAASAEWPARRSRAIAMACSRASCCRGSMRCGRPPIARAFEANRPCPDSVLASAGYVEPSLVFLTATNTLLTDGAGAAKHLKSSACAVAAVEANEAAAFSALHRREHATRRWPRSTASTCRTAGRSPSRSTPAGKGLTTKKGRSPASPGYMPAFMTWPRISPSLLAAVWMFT